MTDDRMLGIYLNDHLAGATAGLELARRLTNAHQDTEHEQSLAQFAEDVAEDRETLIQIMQTLGVRRAHYKTTAAWFAEKAGRVKPNGHLLTRSPLSSLLEVEIMQLGVEGKAAGWRTLRTIAAYDARLDSGQLELLIERARQQSDFLEGLRPVMSQNAFARVAADT